MKLSTIVSELPYKVIQGTLDCEISHIEFDSRNAGPGSLFVAVSGFAADGHQYVNQAVATGAVAVIVEKEIPLPPGVTVLRVSDSREALAQVAAAFYNHPSADFNLIGITGTNGKTSITYLIQSILEQSGRTSGLIGTMGAMIAGQPVKSLRTTPESLHLQQLFASMRETKVNDCVMEVSSHALNLKRTACSQFNIGIFTNLTPDHLEHHLTMEAYFKAKAQLFQMTRDCNIINADDPYGKRLIRQLASRQIRLLTYAIDEAADVYASDIRLEESGSSFKAHTPAGSVDISLCLPGIIYVYNALAAIAAAYASGISLAHIRGGLHSIQGVRGRMETVYQDSSRKVVVDFAHTEDGLEKALLTLRPFTTGRIILVFGVYGAEGRHGRRKQQAMGRVAGQYADMSVVTSDNPRHQDPHVIIHGIEQGLKQVKGRFRSYVDRKQAIHYALRECRPGDVVLITGKGHETTQVIGSQELPFDEKAIVAEYITAWKQLLSAQM